MFYHPSDNTATVIIKHLVFWSSLLAMFGLVIFTFRDEVRIPQREVVVKIDISNKVNICLPEDDKIFKKSFFGF